LRGLLDANTSLQHRLATSYIAFGLLCSGTFVCQAEAPFSFATTPGQLANGVIPQAYRLDIAADLERLRFTGREEIDIDVGQATDVITVNAVDLTIAEVALEGKERVPAK
jgi:hypothetical protein